MIYLYRDDSTNTSNIVFKMNLLKITFSKAALAIPKVYYYPSGLVLSKQLFKVYILGAGESVNVIK